MAFSGPSFLDSKNIKISGSSGAGRLTESATTKPKVVCLCGSTRFFETFQEQYYLETLAGHIVLSVGFSPYASDKVHGEGVGITPEQKIELDELHKRKIDLADEVFVLNVGGYVGDSTRSEIEYATQHGKPVRYLETNAEIHR